ncbi:hypothetical protein IB260_04825 [Pseudomonas sp. PDM23]|uniref:hypothetical protein n=1 Tax=unclassified Pseudomonas TaxID=196821 RepID=UPI001787684A|nr:MULTISPECIES: hypothetical protein [unclassified Pseudomonas]MBD9574628.1 hypothetical protein [Pseudomonas sp. PDM23]MBD9673951.1 hypothetical protein [Pseudomonas sp. PDM21]
MRRLRRIFFEVTKMMVQPARCFFSPIVDFMMIGGLSLLVLALVVALNLQVSTFDISLLAWYLAFFVNGPHFLISYLMLYGGHRGRLLKDIRFFWAGVLAPLLLLGAVGYALMTARIDVLRGLLYLMLFTVGWHYIKQSYGCFIVYSAGQGAFFSRSEQLIIRYSLFPLWWASFLRLFTGRYDNNFAGLPYSLPSVLSDWTRELHLLSLLGVLPALAVFLCRWKRKEKWPGLIAVTPLLMIYLWLSPLLRNEFFLVLIPLFHSLQYMLFSGAYTRSKVRRSGRTWLGYAAWWGSAFVLAALLFNYLPVYLDQLRLLPLAMPINTFMLCFVLFINVHHYFIDNVMWRGGNQEVRENIGMRTLGRTAESAGRSAI